MAWRMTKRSCLSAASFDRVTDFMYRPEPRLSRIRIIVTTIIISSSVKPARASARREIWGELLRGFRGRDRKSTRLNSSHLVISYAVFCLKKKKAQLTRQIQPIAGGGSVVNKRDKQKKSMKRIHKTTSLPQTQHAEQSIQHDNKRILTTHA